MAARVEFPEFPPKPEPPEVIDILVDTVATVIKEVGVALKERMPGETVGGIMVKVGERIERAR